MQDVADGVREAVQECGIGAKAMTVSEGDLDDAGHIGQNKAKELVLAQLGLESASFRDHEYELDDGVYEFTAGGVEYEYEVDARTGKVLEADIDGNDDWDDRDDWDDQDDNNDDRDKHDDLDDRDDDDDDREPAVPAMVSDDDVDDQHDDDADDIDDMDDDHDDDFDDDQDDDSDDERDDDQDD